MKNLLGFYLAANGAVFTHESNVDWDAERRFLDEMDRRQEAAPLYVVAGYGEVRISWNPCDRRQFEISGMCVFALKALCEARGKTWHGAKYLTFTQAVTALDKIVRQMKRANPNYQPEIAV